MENRHLFRGKRIDNGVWACGYLYGIWENDIVDGHIKRGAVFRSCVVLWNECKARFDIRAVDCNFPMTLDECVDDISVGGLDYEVLGNKFDNPELLEVRL